MGERKREMGTDGLTERKNREVEQEEIQERRGARSEGICQLFGKDRLKAVPEK